MLLVAWPLAAFGGRGLLTAALVTIVSVAWSWLIRPRLASDRDSRRFDLWLLATSVVPLAQLLPLPVTVAALVSPHAADLRRALSLAAAPSSAWQPLTITSSDTAWAAIVGLGAVAFFFVAREEFARTGVRHTLRGICGLGFVLAVVALAQAATAGRSIYWRFPTEYEGPLPFGPFVNRNHFATWIIMALPLCAGYLAARSVTHAPARQHAGQHIRTRLAHLADGRTLWLIASGAMMLAALLACGSRSGILALAVAVATTLLLTRRRATGRLRGVLLAIVLVMIGFALLRADVSQLAGRFGRVHSDVQGRVRIWQDTLPLVGDFWLAGTGAGTYRTAMLVYQRNDRDVQFNQAHNHYLQAAAEGGLLLVAPMIGGLWSLARAARVRLAAEPGAAYWIRAGAACGLLAVALQSVWEAGLVMPANAMLAALVAAVVLHGPTRPLVRPASASD